MEKRPGKFELRIGEGAAWIGVGNQPVSEQGRKGVAPENGCRVKGTLAMKVAIAFAHIGED
jgi:hypothetical protein